MEGRSGSHGVNGGGQVRVGMETLGPVVDGREGGEINISGVGIFGY